MVVDGSSVHGSGILQSATVMHCDQCNGMESSALHGSRPRVVSSPLQKDQNVHKRASKGLSKNPYTKIHDYIICVCLSLSCVCGGMWCLPASFNCRENSP